VDIEPARLNFRLDAARSYFSALREATSRDWSALWDRYQAGSLSDAEALALIHPVWLEGVSGSTPSRRRRTFGLVIPNYESCASSQIWGYACPFERRLEVDHLFPWGLGGPTRPENAVYLCQNHNRAKGHDVHLIPWERAETFAWLGDEIAETARLLGA
jgi:hypothetical protein